MGRATPDRKTLPEKSAGTTVSQRFKALLKVVDADADAGSNRITPPGTATWKGDLAIKSMAELSRVIVPPPGPIPLTLTELLNQRKPLWSGVAL